MPLGGTLYPAHAYRTRTFARWQRRTGLQDQTLIAAVSEMRAGLIDADLGGGVLKKRVAWQGRGKRGGGRLLVATNRNDRWIFLIGFTKNERSDISPREFSALQKWSGDLLALDETELAAALAAGELQEIPHACPGTKEESNPGRGVRRRARPS